MIIFSSHEGLNEFKIIALKEVDSPIAMTPGVTDRFAWVIQSTASFGVILQL